jgi:hypothetical protein
MNLLQLVQETRNKCGAAGVVSTVVGVSGEALRFVNWVKEAWEEIQQRRPDWRFMRQDFSFPTVANKPAYLLSATAGETLVTDHALWLGDTFRIFDPAIGKANEQYLPEWSYTDWRDTFDFGGQANNRERPMVWARRDRDAAILLGNTPNKVYTIAGQYMQAPVALGADIDTPAMPARFHRAIVYRAMMEYAHFETAPEVYTQARGLYDRMIAIMENELTEQIGFGEPLA